MSLYTAIVPKISKIVAGKPRLEKSYQQFDFVTYLTDVYPK